MQCKTQWDLAKIYTNTQDPQIQEDLQDMKQLVQTFGDRWSMDEGYKIDKQKLLESIQEYENICISMRCGGKALVYIEMQKYLDMDNEEYNAKSGKYEDIYTECANQILFWENAIGRLDKSFQQSIMQDNSFAKYHNRLRKQFANAQYTLSDTEEKLINKLSKTAYSNWRFMINKLLGQIEKDRDIGGEKSTKTFEELLALSGDNDENTRDTAYAMTTDILDNLSDIATIELNSILEYKKTSDEIRNISRPDLTRIISDDLSPEIVDTLIRSISDKQYVSHKYYGLLAKILKKDKLKYNERSISISNISENIEFGEGLEIVHSVFNKLDPEFSNYLQNQFDKGNVDIYPKKGKYGGAFCSDAVLGDEYVLLNYTNTTRDITTIAHEFGHALHGYYNRSNNILNQNFGNSIAEIASTFFEDFVYTEVLDHTSDRYNQISLYMQKILDSISTIYRQHALYIFEAKLHSTYRTQGYLSKDTIGKLFVESMQGYLGEHFDLVGAENRRVYRGHIRSYFYSYPYSFGLLVSKGLQNLVKQDPANISKVKEFMKAGDSKPPQVVFADIGIDICDPKFWETGLSEIEADISRCESLAQELGLI